MIKSEVISYSVKYKKFGSLFYRKIQGVISDGIFESNIMPHRWFVTQSEVRYEVPIEGVIFQFSSNRAKAIQRDRDLSKIQKQLQEKK